MGYEASINQLSKLKNVIVFGHMGTDGTKATQLWEERDVFSHKMSGAHMRSWDSCGFFVSNTGGRNGSNL